MVKHDNLTQLIDAFHAEYGVKLKALSSILDEARISHYSSGCGPKSITYDIFPASGYVNELLAMVSLNRAHKIRQTNGFRDACAAHEANPGHTFILYLRRWALFAEQIMKKEGASQRGIVSAHAKLMITELLALLYPEPVAPAKPYDRKAMTAQQAPNDFFVLMRHIGLYLEARESAEKTAQTEQVKKATEDNYSKAMAMAKRHLNLDSQQSQAA